MSRMYNKNNKQLAKQLRSNMTKGGRKLCGIDTYVIAVLDS